MIDIGTILSDIVPFFIEYVLIGLVCGIIAGYIISSVSGQRIVGLAIGIIIAVAVCLIPYTKNIECEQCGADMKIGQAYCEQCGNKNEGNSLLGKIECRNCGRHIDSNANICGYCGTSIN